MTDESDALVIWKALAWCLALVLLYMIMEAHGCGGAGLEYGWDGQ